jgi:serine/threonine protein kinase
MAMHRHVDRGLRLELVREIASGGMGTVYEALQEGADGFRKRVAVKSLRPELSRDPGFVGMFIDEAKLVADLVHENIVQTYQLERDARGYFIVMEYVRGVSLHELLQVHAGDDRLPVRLAVFIASRVARGLAYAHSRVASDRQPLGIVHRDVCPKNVLITTEGLPKLTDFGIARARDRGGPSEQFIAGKLAYMAPEQAMHFDLDGRADVYALGAVLFELLTGTKIRAATTPTGLLRRARGGEVDWEVWRRCDLESALEAMVARCLAVREDERYPTAAELAHDLEYFIYKDGYGPTTSTLAAHLAGRFPHLYPERSAV